VSLRRLLAAAVAAGSAAVVATTYRVFVTTVRGQRLDEATRGGAYEGSAAVDHAHAVLGVVSAASLLVALAVVVLIALARRRVRLALAVAVLVVGSTLTTQVLKTVVLHRPDLGARFGSAVNSLPSGHTTFAASVSLALLLVVPVRLRPVVALAGAGYTAVTGIATLVVQWHRASDVVAAIAVVAFWGALVSVVTPVEEVQARRPPARLAHRTVAGVLATGVLAGAGVAAGGAALVWPRSGAPLDGVLQHVAFGVGAGGVVAASCAMALALQLLRQPRRVPSGQGAPPGSAAPVTAGSVP
jgi:membrane-associated phospholipid phosphatase